MNMTREHKEGVEIVKLSGSLDFYSSPPFRNKFQKILQTRPERLLVDLTDVAYIDSSGLATFIEAFQVMKRYQGQLIMAGLQERVFSVFQIAKLDQVFSLAETKEEALQQLIS